MARVLIVDDDDVFREALGETLQSLGHAVDAAAGGEQALERLGRGGHDLVFLDQRMPGLDGLATLAAATNRPGRVPPIIMLTAHAGSAGTIEAMRLGAFDHLAKPISRDAVIDAVQRALAAAPEAPPAASAPARAADDGELVGVSEAMRSVHKRIGLAAASAAPVVIHGETGTGKELVARALHRHSARAGGPFVAVNCAAIPGELLESELFGHVKGAYTGAATDRPGCFRAADGGVLLLDEIGDMGLEVQAKLLRVLQEGEVTPLGSHRPVRVDVRVVAATHRNLAAAVAEGRFREDLRYRLDVLQIQLPPLRERLADIVPLAEHFLRRAAHPDAPKRLSAAAAQQLLAHAWPGNVRELRNAMERAHALHRGQVIPQVDLGAAPATTADADAGRQLTLPEALQRLERQMLVQALAEAGGNRSHAARRLGINRQLLYARLAAYGLE